MKGIIVFCITFTTLCTVSELLAFPLPIYEGRGGFSRGGSVTAVFEMQDSVAAKRERNSGGYTIFCLGSYTGKNILYYRSPYLAESPDNDSFDNEEWLYSTYSDGSVPNGSGLSVGSFPVIIPSGI